MPPAETYSHRDQRAHRSIDRALGGLVGIVAVLTVAAMLAPVWWFAWVAVLGLLAVGAAYVVWGSRMVEQYARDLRMVGEGDESAGFLRAEVGSTRGLSPSLRLGPSPHRRSRRPMPGELEGAETGVPATASEATRDRPEVGP